MSTDGLTSPRVALYSVPTRPAGGAGAPQDLVDVLTEADAAIIASMSHTGERTIRQIKDALIAAGVPVRRKW